MRHRVMLFNPRYGVVGTIVFPFFAIFEMIGPALELMGLVFVTFSYFLGVVDVPFMILFLLVSVLFGVLLSILSLVLEELSYHSYPRWRDLARMTLFAVLENFGYRQLTLWWRVKGIWDFLRGQKQWGAMVRKGFARPS